MVDQIVFVAKSAVSMGTAPRVSAVDTRLPEAAEYVTAFEWLDIHHRVLALVFKEFSTRPKRSIASKIRLITHQIHHAAREHHNALLAAIHLNKDMAPSHNKAFQVAILCELIGRRIYLPANERKSLICSALTHDVAMWQLSDELQLRDAPLTDEHKQKIQNHPDDGLNLLKKAHIDDPIWLETVHQHHERLDGQGYPNGLEGEQVKRCSRVLAIADTFTAMITPRGDRDQSMPKDALKELFLLRGKEMDGTLAQIFIKEVGLFPPGTLIRLKNNEIAIATGPGTNASTPDIRVIMDAQGKSMVRPLRRDCNSKEYRIMETVSTIEQNLHLATIPSIWPRIPLSK